MKRKDRKISLIRKIVSMIDSTVNIAVLLFFILCVLFSGYSIWDNNHIYTKASPSVYETYKPEKENTKSFEELIRINPDVYGWITLYGTEIDYPLVQGEDNDKYVNTDYEGNFSLSGALFLDCNNTRDMRDTVNIIYGHHMEKDKMFGGLDHYEKQDYFKEHQYGNLYVDGTNYGLEFFMLIKADAYDSSVYNIHASDANTYIETIEPLSIQSFDIEDANRLVVLSTCSDSTNGRTLLIGKICDETFEDPYLDKEETEEESSIDWYHMFLYGIMIVLILCILIVLVWSKKK